MAEATLPLRTPALGEGLAGIAGAAAALPLVLMLGLLAFAATGAQAATLGLAAALASSIGGGLVVAALGRTPMPAAGPSSAIAVVFAGLVATLITDPALAQHPALLLALAGAGAAASGGLLLVMAALRVGSLARHVPQQVLAGFMNGVALLILAAQAAPLLGLPGDAWGREGLAALQQAQLLPLLVGAGTAALAFTLARRVPRWPAALVALLAGVAAVQLLQALGAPALPHLQPATAAMPWLPAWSVDGATLASAVQRHAGTLALHALLMALLGGLESLLGMAATEQTFGARSRPNRELAVLGLANISSGLLGGMPVVYQRLRAVATWRAGGRTRQAAAVGALLLGAALTLGRPLAGQLPLAVLAGLMVVTAFTLIDGWTGRLLRQWWAGPRQAELRRSLAVVAVVCGVTLWRGFAAGVAVGVVLSVALFMQTMNRSLLRAVRSGAQQPSRRVYAPAQEAWLAGQRTRIHIFELEGALFFGSADRLAEEADRLPPGTAALVADLRRVTTLDASGAVQLMLLADRLAQRGVSFTLAGVSADNRHGRVLQDADVWRPALAFVDADHAVEAAEQALLAQAGAALLAPSLPLRDCALADGLDAPQLARLQARMPERRLAAGEWLFREGDAGDRLYVVAEGSVSVVGVQGQRFVSFSPGMSFGETAVLDGRGRTAGGRADVDSRVYELPAAALEALRDEDPALAAQLYRNLARHLSERLRSAAEAWRHAAS